MINIVTLRNRVGSYYHRPVFDPKPKEDIAKELVRYCRCYKDAAIKGRYHECELYLLGQFDDETGKIFPCEPEFLVDLGHLFTPEDLKQANEVKEIKIQESSNAD